MNTDSSSKPPTSDPSHPLAIVAGGSGGLGRAICESLARNGHSLAVLFRSRESAAQETIASLHKLGVAAEAHKLNLCDAKGTAETIKTLCARFGEVRTAVYAAGPTITIDYLSRIPAEEFLRVLTEDAGACLNFIQAVLPSMRKNGGALIGITTEQLERIELRGALSSVPKAAVDKMFEVVAKEEARHGIRAATVRAGWVNTGLGADALESKLPESALKALIGSIPMQRFGLPREIGDVVAFLASPLASYVTGISIPVNGGRHL